jgi:hypothetical protein
MVKNQKLADVSPKHRSAIANSNIFLTPIVRYFAEILVGDCQRDVSAKRHLPFWSPSKNLFGSKLNSTEIDSNQF